MGTREKSMWANLMDEGWNLVGIAIGREIARSLSCLEAHPVVSLTEKGEGEWDAPVLRK